MPRLDIFTNFVENPIIQSSGKLDLRSKNLSLAERLSLASDAILVSKILEFLDDIKNQLFDPKIINLETLNSVIILLNEYSEGNRYLTQRKSYLMHRPQSVDTVIFIKKQGDFEFVKYSKQATSFFENLRNDIESGSEIKEVELDNAQSIIHLFRRIHDGIMSQLDSIQKTHFG